MSDVLDPFADRCRRNQTDRVLEGERHLARRSKTLSSIARETFFHRGDQRGRRVRRELGEVRRRPFEHFQEQRRLAVGDEEPPPGEQLPEEDAGGEHVVST